MRSMVLLAAFLLAAPAFADIYTWRDASGAKRMSNVAPPWYSETEPRGPRTQVLVNGHLVDDTWLSPEERTKLQAMRARAESWGRGDPAARRTEAQAAVQTARDTAQPKPATGAALPAGIPAEALEGLKRALEAQQAADKLAGELKATNRPR
ncbi:MAG: DUF4124 domain-containing protein [Burkholderiales bacterium]